VNEIIINGHTDILSPQCGLFINEFHSRVSDGPGSGRTGLYGLLFRFAGNSVRSASSGPLSGSYVNSFPPEQNLQTKPDSHSLLLHVCNFVSFGTEITN